MLFIIIRKSTGEIVCWTNHLSCVDKYEYYGQYYGKRVNEIPEGIEYEEW